VGTTFGVIDPRTASAVVLLAVGSVLLLPWLYRHLLAGTPGTVAHGVSIDPPSPPELESTDGAP
jgi:hypothetical protein